jgi:hypothetical protein
MDDLAVGMIVKMTKMQEILMISAEAEQIITAKRVTNMYIFGFLHFFSFISL